MRHFAQFIYCFLSRFKQSHYQCLLKAQAALIYFRHAYRLIRAHSVFLQYVVHAKHRLGRALLYHLVRALKWKKEEKAELLLIAVRPDYQGLGVNALFFDDLIPVYNERHFKWAETGPQLEDNVKELTQWKPLHPTLTKRRRCYKKKL